MRSMDYDVVVIGAGHAGCEAALAAARMGRSVLVMALSVEKVAHMPCNPAIGGVGKGQLVREIDALGGQMGRTIDRSMVQIKTLNSSKGPAVQALRAQADKRLYSYLMKKELLKQEGLSLLQAEAREIEKVGEREIQVVTAAGDKYVAASVVITTGTFLRGMMTIGELTAAGGRAGGAASDGLSDALRLLGVELGRFQSATPPRVAGQTCRTERMKVQPGDDGSLAFSFTTRSAPKRRQQSCWLTHTTSRTHELIRRNIHLSPIKSGSVSAKGPRYCPSIDRKVINFPDRDQHPVFVEPEGWKTEEMYLQGLTTSMPVAIQEKIIQTVPGLEEARLVRPGYAVAYDYVASGQLGSGLEVLAVPGLFTAGQINGTSGYEEAAAQGLVAGINAARYCAGESAFVLGRSEAYIGVLVDDLVRKEIDEPYRMFTSRAEHRLILRSDNADLRLAPVGHKLGLVDEETLAVVEAKRQDISLCLTRLESARIGGRRAKDLLKRPEVLIEELLEIAKITSISVEARREAETEIKYEGYIQRQLRQIAAQRNLEETLLPPLDYEQLQALSIEARVKLARIKPRSLGQAARIAGVSPADISVLMVHIAQRGESGQ